MKRHIVTAAFISWLTGVCATAATVNHDAAYQYATEFLSERGLSATLSPVNLSAISRSATASQNAAVHIFNIGEGDGFVIIAGDDRARKILAYSDTGSIETATMPEACRAWVEQYADEISSLPSEDTSCNYKSIKPETYRKQTTQIAPLLKSRWDQKLPYNMLCPVDATTGLQCVTGCVATATAQVMYYHRYPSQATGTVTYEDKNQNVTRTLDFSTIAPFEWNSMSDTYTVSSTGSSAEAVASLLYAVGHGTKMQYSSDTSIAYYVDAAKALIDYFGYDGNMHFYERSLVSDSEWTSIILSELKAGRPVIYGGKNPAMGHCFVCDGYDGNGYFHFNWGWSGLSDGYYSLSALNPSEQSTGGSSNGYSLGQTIICNIAPQGTSGLAPQTDHLLNIDKLYFRDATAFHLASETPELHTSLDDSMLFFYSLNKGLNDFTGEVCAAIITDGNIKPIATTVITDIKNSTYATVRFPLSDISVSDGTHRIGFYYRQSESDSWHRISSSTETWPSECYMTVSGRNVTLRPSMPTVNVTLASDLKWNHLLSGSPATWSFEIANSGDIRLEGYAGVALADAPGSYKAFYTTPVLCPAGETIDVDLKSTLAGITAGTYEAVPFYSYTHIPTADDITPLAAPVSVTIGQIIVTPADGSYLMTDNADTPLRLTVTNMCSAQWEGMLQGEIISAAGKVCQGLFSANVTVGANGSTTALLKGENLDLQKGNYILNLYVAPGRDILIASVPLLVTAPLSALDEITAGHTEVTVTTGTISIISPSPLSRVLIHDTSGRLLLSKEIDSTKTTIATDDMAGGICILTIVKADGSREVRKINIRTR